MILLALRLPGARRRALHLHLHLLLRGFQVGREEDERAHANGRDAPGRGRAEGRRGVSYWICRDCGRRVYVRWCYYCGRCWTCCAAKNKDKSKEANK